jgi:hypothetical protein
VDGRVKPGMMKKRLGFKCVEGALEMLEEARTTRSSP